MASNNHTAVKDALTARYVAGEELEQFLTSGGPAYSTMRRWMRTEGVLRPAVKAARRYPVVEQLGHVHRCAANPRFWWAADNDNGIVGADYPSREEAIEGLREAHRCGTAR